MGRLTPRSHALADMCYRILLFGCLALPGLRSVTGAETDGEAGGVCFQENTLCIGV
jgi:hypothetical protein